MPRRFSGVFAITILFASIAAISPAAATPSAPAGDYARALAATRVVETVEIGVLGSTDAPTIRTRTLNADAADRLAPFEVKSSLVATSSTTESCFYARPTYTRYNGFGKLSSRAWYYIEWCGRDGIVTRVLTLYCGGVASGGFSYKGCSVRRGATGYSRLNVSGVWRFPFSVGIYTFVTRTITVSARHYPNGRYAGTWRMYQ